MRKTFANLFLLGTVGLGSMMIGMTSCSDDDKENGGGQSPSAKTHVNVQSIALYPKIMSLLVQDEWSLKVDFLPQDASNRNVSWVSRNVDIAKVSDGIITGVSTGETWIVCTSADNENAKDSCKVKVNEDIVADLKSLYSIVNGLCVKANALDSKIEDQINGVCSQIDQLNARVDTIKEEDLVKLADSIKLLNEGLVALQSTVTGISAIVDNLNHETTGLKNTVTDLVSKVNTMTVDIPNLQNQVNNLTTAIGSNSAGLTKTVNDLNTSVSNLKSTVGSTESGLVKAVSDLEEKVNTLHP